MENAYLYVHVVKRRGHGPRADGACITTRDGNHHRMEIGFGEYHYREHVCRPLATTRWQDFKRDETRQNPYLTDGRQQKSLVELLTKPGEENSRGDEEYVGRYGEQIRFEGTESGSIGQYQSEVLSHWMRRHQPAQAQEVDGPHVVIA